MQFPSRSPEDTQNLGRRIGRLLQAGDILLLFGDLGAGKTTLIQGIAQGMEVPPDQYVRSPSFTLINEYRGRLPIYHIDLYRIESADEMADLGLEDYLFGEGVTLIEWGEKLFPEQKTDQPPLIPINNRVEIRLEIGGETDRTLSLSPYPQASASHPLFALQ
ncbi:tRNA (adenosine(37)-N6)-threonylcarbamoyltransferase complex ATPase subunit type 1 TsaE [Nitrospina gracilis]|uniref:tRNA (adenosine(37)-N6)-threonylcarbamoyltransferase complex ATPase subunit type 1 TsaE n=1 Tax=Nitrospina gracilis TaxID=35801 RepID=UPI001F000560|nr:tRNA (adenosine(37)-N6)-threonylcarbamoyltransferase complex ATPase subunit type 1 TsaE [Nitrospina gracilis]MCF8720771.1 tRNA threonylcarbamoyladenosine biosynthesis protein TsaE [Nitrospina gracilis Nb-211]